MNFNPCIPILRIFDEVKTKEFYLDYLGFKIDWDYKHTPELPWYFQVSKGNCKIHLSEHYGDCSPGASIRVECDELDLFLKQLKQKKYNYANPIIIDQPWGSREMTITDPFQNKLTFFDTKNAKHHH